MSLNWLLWLLVIVSILYGFTGIVYAFNGRAAMGVVFLGYIIANVGLIYDVLK